ncbi:Nif11-like leader peptide family natural product precursor, partial [Leptolyngbya sp. FACHB-36]|uniref:Nif11-like leader peptide family natural product precursor n=1 Tax=Leptolyngbya sp. FACHB-36 TaxID=2692808 RepID=UPI001680D3D9
MTSHRAAEFFKAVQQDQALQARLQAVSDPKAFIQIAADRGYTFSEEELEQA